MDSILEFVQANVVYAPFIVCGLLLLAGLNVPVSEDGMIIISALLAVKNPDYIIPLYLGVYLGAYLSDLESYWLGRLVGPRLWNIKWFARMVSREKVDQIGRYYQKYGGVTLLLGRFIPFGVRNGLFITAGLGRMSFARFAFFDFIASVVSVTTLFTLTYFLGEIVIDYVQKSKVYIFIAALTLVLALLIRKWRKGVLARRESANGTPE